MEVVLSLNTFQATGSAKFVRRSAACGTGDVYLHMSQCKRVTMSCDGPLISLRGRLVQLDTDGLNLAQLGTQVRIPILGMRYVLK
jgi:hypothetical protein